MKASSTQIDYSSPSYPLPVSLSLSYTHTHCKYILTYPLVQPLSYRRSPEQGIALGLAPPLTPPPQPSVGREGSTSDQTDSYHQVCYEHHIWGKGQNMFYVVILQFVIWFQEAKQLFQEVNNHPAST